MMLIRFFYFLRQQQLRVSIQEFITLIESLCSTAAPISIDEFYYLARLVLIKDESLFDKYDRAFTQFYGLLSKEIADGNTIPADWLVKTLERQLSDEQKAALKKQKPLFCNGSYSSYYHAKPALLLAHALRQVIDYS